MTQTHAVRVHPSADRLAREDQLAWKIALVAADPVAVPDDVVDMIINRVIDNAAVNRVTMPGCAEENDGAFTRTELGNRGSPSMDMPPV